jgi:5'-3' exonuclease
LKVHLVDGTFELFRSFFGTPRSGLVGGREVGATRGLLSTLMALLRERDVTHVAVAFDNVIESFRNRLFDGYKTGEGVEPELRAQFELAERATAALGLVVWPMVEFEADDALAAGAARFKGAPGVEQVVICSPDKDVAQCVEGTRVIYRDRMRNVVRDEKAVIEKFGVAPVSIPDWLALVGDAADGIPGIPGWGAKSSAAVLARYGTIASIPDAESDWDVDVRSRARLATALSERREDAMLYRKLATLRTDVPLAEELHALRWQGAHRRALESLCAEIGMGEFLGRVPRWQAG